MEETLRRIIREELEAVEERISSLETRVSDGFTRMDEKFVWTEERFDWVGQRFDAIDERFDRMEDALIIVAQWTAGSMPDRESHVAKKVRRALGRSGPPSPLAQAAKGGS